MPKKTAKVSKSLTKASKVGLSKTKTKMPMKKIGLPEKERLEFMIKLTERSILKAGKHGIDMVEQADRLRARLAELKK